MAEATIALNSGLNIWSQTRYQILNLIINLINLEIFQVYIKILEF